MVETVAQQKEKTDLLNKKLRANVLLRIVGIFYVKNDEFLSLQMNGNLSMIVVTAVFLAVVNAPADVDMPRSRFTY